MRPHSRKVVSRILRWLTAAQGGEGHAAGGRHTHHNVVVAVSPHCQVHLPPRVDLTGFCVLKEVARVDEEDQQRLYPGVQALRAQACPTFNGNSSRSGLAIMCLAQLTVRTRFRVASRARIDATDLIRNATPPQGE